MRPNFVEDLINQNMKGKTIIKVEGLLDNKWKSSFEGMEISYEDNNTILTGNIKDEAHIPGILNQIRDLNLKLISVNPHEINN
jgi:hypothetical protein